MTPKEKLALLLIIFFGAAIRFYFILDTGIWADEGQYVWVAMAAKNIFKLQETYQSTAHHQPIGTFLLLHLWGRFWGWAPGQVRLLFTLASSLSVLTTWLAGRWIFKSEKTALWAALFMALSPFSIRYAYEASPYALLNLLAPLSIGLFVAKLKRPEGVLDASWLLVNLALLNLHYYSYFLVLAEGLLWLWLSPLSTRQKVKTASLASGIYAVGSLPLILLFDPEIARANHAWLSISGESFLTSVLNVFNYSRVIQWLQVVAFVCGVAYAYTRSFSPLLWVTLLPLGLAWASKFVFWNVFGHERYLMIIFPGLILLMAGISRKRFVGGLFALALLAGVIFNQPNQTIHDFDSVSRYIGERYDGKKNESTLLTPQCCNWALYYYLTLRGVALTHPIFDPQLALHDVPKLEKELAEKKAWGAKQIFLVLFYDGDEYEKALRDLVGRRFVYSDERNFQGVRVVRFLKKSSS